jgi:hypothetical protein
LNHPSEQLQIKFGRAGRLVKQFHYRKRLLSGESEISKPVLHFATLRIGSVTGDVFVLTKTHQDNEPCGKKKYDDFD